MNQGLVFYDPGMLYDGDLQLVLIHKYPGDINVRLSPAYKFEMRTTYGCRMGNIDLRIGHTHNLITFGGHIGYRVEPAYRGHHYAARSCQLILPLARRHSINPVWITCNPDNTPSRRTCERIGGTLVEIVEIPPELDMYHEGERFKCRYRVDL